MLFDFFSIEVVKFKIKLSEILNQFVELLKDWYLKVLKRVKLFKRIVRVVYILMFLERNLLVIERRVFFRKILKLMNLV